MRYVSIKTVIGRIITDVGTHVSFPFSSMKEWISSVVKMHLPTPKLAKVSYELEIKNHRVSKPCDILQILAVTNVATNCRMHYGLDVRDSTRNRDIEIPSSVEEEFKSFHFPAVTLVKVLDDEGNLIKQIMNPKVDLEKQRLNFGEDYYEENMDYIQTSFESGTIIVDGLELYKDEDGFLMIPDSEVLKEAIYYWVLNKLIGRGYKHPVLGFSDTYTLYKDYARKISGVLNFPSVDKWQSVINDNVELMPTLDKWETFYNNREQL
jgi:hypothetical protein